VHLPARSSINRGVSASRPKGWRSHISAPQLLLVPGLAFLALAFMAPILLLLSRSFLNPDFTLRNYQRLLAVPEYAQVFLISFEMAAVTTILSLIFGYPLAYVMARVSNSWRTAILAIILLPFWTNILVRCYAWMLILQTKGILNIALVDWLGLFPSPLALVYNFTGVTVGMVHYLLPPTVLILYSVMRLIDVQLLDAAESLGARPWRAFWRIYFPLTAPGLRAATILIFIMGIGLYVTPALLGGRRELTIAMLINTQFTELLNWGFGSALAVILLLVTLAGLYLYYILAATKKAS
jgi:putative spermidine/putrescine transport system permease protein